MRLGQRGCMRGGEPLGTGDIAITTLLGVMAGYPGVFLRHCWWA